MGSDAAVAKYTKKGRAQHARSLQPQPVKSLLDRMEDGNEYGSIVSLVPQQADLVPEVRRALAEIEAIRGRPCICYLANVVREVPDTSIVASDHLPFSEMVGRIDASAKEVDVLLATPGGSGEQVTLFVDALRARFERVEFLIPYKAMSAGTLWSLSGDKIWMDDRAFLGPIDPQVPGRDGRYVPAQSLLTLLNMIQQEGEKARQKGGQPPWSYVVLLREMDQRQLGAVITASQYVITMASEFLAKYKFKTWEMHKSTSTPVTPQDRLSRAFEAASALCSHDRWKAHGHAITRDVVWRELRVEIDHPETVQGLSRALRRMWALCYYVFDKGALCKMMLSQNYVFARNVGVITRPAP